MGSKKERHQAKVAEKKKSTVASKRVLKRKFLIIAAVLVLLFLIPIAAGIASPYLNNYSLSPASYQTKTSSTVSSPSNFNVNVQVVREPKTQPATTADVITYYHNDHNGQPLYMSDESGNIVWRREQEPYGEETLQHGSVEENLRTPGQYHDKETGLNANGYRDYNPQTGTYIEPDPIGQAGSVNAYPGVDNNPVNYVDPTGLYWEYSQSSGHLTYVDNQTGKRTPAGTCYSGKGPGLNNPAMQNVPKVGPIPQGAWNIGPAYRHPILGPTTMNLVPKKETNTFGRTAFRMHGDNAQRNKSASEGCIVAPQCVRKKVSTSDDRDLKVVQ